jgi:hypothetical protein
MGAFEDFFDEPVLWPDSLGLAAGSELVGVPQKRYGTFHRPPRGKGEAKPSSLLLGLFQTIGMRPQLAATGLTTITIAASAAVTGQHNVHIENSVGASHSGVVIASPPEPSRSAHIHVKHGNQLLPGTSLGVIPSSFLSSMTERFNLFDYNKPRIDVDFDPMALRAELIEDELKAAQLSNVDRFPGNDGDYVVEAGPAERSLTFVIKPINTLALYRLGHPEEYSKVSVTELPRIPSREQIATLVQDYKHASEWQTTS